MLRLVQGDVGAWKNFSCSGCSMYALEADWQVGFNGTHRNFSRAALFKF